MLYFVKVTDIWLKLTYQHRVFLIEEREKVDREHKIGMIVMFGIIALEIAIIVIGIVFNES